MKRMAGLASATWLILCATMSAEETIEPLFPLKVGSVWTYRVLESRTSKPEKEKFRSKDGFKNKDDFKSKDEPKSNDEPKNKAEAREPLTIQIKVVKKVKFGKDEGYELATLANGKVNATEQVVVKADGIYREVVNELKPDVPFKILALPAASGTKWLAKCEFVVSDANNNPLKVPLTGEFSIKEEDVTVGGVKHSMATLVESKSLKISNHDSSMKCWFVKDIGIVKFVYRMGDEEATLELEKFEKK
jgi:hypothetical protein